MEIEFINSIPKNYKGSTILISGESSIYLNKRQFLSLSDGGKILNIYEIKYEYQCSPFKQTQILKNIIAIGHEEHFYLFDIINSIQITVLKLSGYFGEIYLNDGLIYIADANGLHCVKQNGTLIWTNNELGIDGVIINNFIDSEIHGIGEWNPPGGWEEFVIDKETGEKKNKKLNSNI